MVFLLYYLDKIVVMMYAHMLTNRGKFWCDLDGFLLKKSELAIHAVTTWVAAVYAVSFRIIMLEYNLKLNGDLYVTGFSFVSLLVRGLETCSLRC